MDICDRHGLKAAAFDALSHAPGHRRQVLIWCGASTALSIIASVLSFFLDSQIAGTGGLSGIGLRSILSTVQSALSLGVSLLLPFWNAGYTASVLGLSRKEHVFPGTLWEGFRRFGPVLRLQLTTAVIHAGIIMACFYGGSIVLSFTPLAAPVYEVMAQSSDMLLSGTIDDASLYAIMEAMIPMLIGCAVLYLAVVIPVLYRLRLTQFLIVDQPGCGALQAIRTSFRLMKRNCLTILRLDLSFWWYWAAQVLLAALCYGDLILPLLGISLPFNAETAYFVFYIASMLARLALFYGFSNYVQTTYAKFYDALHTPPEETNSLAL